jgi:hypothetical protein
MLPYIGGGVEDAEFALVLPVGVGGLVEDAIVIFLAALVVEPGFGVVWLG